MGTTRSAKPAYLGVHTEFSMSCMCLLRSTRNVPAEEENIGLEIPIHPMDWKLLLAPPVVRAPQDYPIA